MSIQSSKKLLDVAEKEGRTGYGETSTITTETDNKIQVLDTVFNINNDGTLTDLTNDLQWIRAPWGMIWNGNNFSGNPVSVDWKKATSLFGKGVKVAGWKNEQGVDMGALKPELMNTSEKFNGYEKGSCRVEFAGHDDWRLPTCIEFHKSMFYNVDPYGSQSFKHNPQELLDKLFINARNISFWTSNEREYPEDSWAEKIVTRIMKSSLVAWSARASYGNIMDDRMSMKYQVLFVREIA